jgi:hypothetical protein
MHALLSPQVVAAKGPDQQKDYTSPPRKDPEQKFRRLGSKFSGGNYIYRERKPPWWSGEQRTSASYAVTKEMLSVLDPDMTLIMA